MSPIYSSRKRATSFGTSFNDGKYYAYLSVTDDNNPKTGIRPGESANPVKTLRMRYDAWVKAGAPRLAPPPPSLLSSDGANQQQRRRRELATSRRGAPSSDPPRSVRQAHGRAIKPELLMARVDGSKA